MGTDMKLPVGVAPRYMKFVGWLNQNTGETIDYDPNDPNTGTYHVPDEEHLKPVYFKMLYVDYYYWNVVWVDGLGNIISIDNVYDKELLKTPKVYDFQKNGELTEGFNKLTELEIFEINSK